MGIIFAILETIGIILIAFVITITILIIRMYYSNPREKIDEGEDIKLMEKLNNVDNKTRIEKIEKHKNKYLLLVGEPGYDGCYGEFIKKNNDFKIKSSQYIYHIRKIENGFILDDTIKIETNKNGKIINVTKLN